MEGTETLLLWLAILMAGLGLVLVIAGKAKDRRPFILGGIVALILGIGLMIVRGGVDMAEEATVIEEVDPDVAPVPDDF